MTDELRNRTALVTGGGSGIGEASARALAAQGASVVVADINPERAESVASSVGGSTWVVDLTDAAALESMNLGFDILVNNAGVQTVSPIEEFPPERFRMMLRLMVETPFLLVRAALPHMYRQGFGRVINITSVHGMRASPYKSAYVAAKHALEGFSKVVAAEGGPKGVTSNCISPGYVRTPLVEAQIADQASAHGISPQDVIDSVLLQRSAIKRLIEPEDVGQMVAWVASDAAAMVTGASWTIDGGWSAQ